IGPAAGTKIGVERDARAALARLAERREQSPAPAFRIDRQRNRREIDEIVAAERLQQAFGLGEVQQAARRRTFTPMVEAALAFVVGRDHVEARQLALEPRDFCRADAFGLPARDHLVAQGIVAERGDVIDGDAKARQIDRRVERVAAKAARIEAGAGLLQLDHALADAGYAGHVFAVCLQATKFPPSSSSMWMRMMSSKLFSAVVKPSWRARLASKLRGQPSTMPMMNASGSRLIRAATFSPATRLSAAICSPTVADRPGMVSPRRGPAAARSMVAACWRKPTAERGVACQWRTVSGTGRTASLPASGSRRMLEKKPDAALLGRPGRMQMVGRRIEMPSRKPRRE